MKRSKRIILLLGILLVVCVATVIVNKTEEHKEKIKNSDKVILQIPVDAVKTLSWNNKSNNLAFHKNIKWYYDEDEAFPVNQDKINELLEPFEEFGASFIIEDVNDYGQYGLDDPVCTIKLATDEKSYTITVGKFSRMDSERYVSIGDGNVYLVKKDPMDYFDVELSDLIDNDDIPSFDKVTGIQFSGTENYSIVYEENSPDTYCDDDVYFARMNGRKLPLDTSRVDSYLKSISNLNLKDYVTYKASDDELQKYGLNSPELTVTVNYTLEDENGGESEDTFVLNISRDPGERRKAGENGEKEDNGSDKDENITAYARVGKSKIIYKISSDNYKKLAAASYNSLRHTEVLTADFEDINRIDISLEGYDYTITTSGKENNRTYHYRDEEIDIKDLKEAMQNLKADKFTDEQPSKKKEIGMKVYIDNENHPEVDIELYRYDGTYCLAVVDGEPVSLVKRSYVVDLIEAVNAIVLD